MRAVTCLILATIFFAGFSGGCAQAPNDKGSPSTHYYNPTWTPSGEVLVERRTGDISIMILITTESTPDIVIFDLPGPTKSIVCAPDCSRIAYNLDDKFNIVSFNGSNETLVAHVTKQIELYDWSTDSSKILFRGIADTGIEGLFVYELTTEALVRLVSAEGYEYYTWHNGSKILFCKVSEHAYGDYDTYTINPDNTGKTYITDQVWRDPQYYPGGTTILSNGTTHLFYYDINLGDQGFVTLQPYPVCMDNCRLSFDGTSVVFAFSNNQGGPAGIKLMYSDGSNIRIIR